MRELLPAIGVVYISGYGGDDLVRRGLGALDGALLRKPFTVRVADFGWGNNTNTIRLIDRPGFGLEYVAEADIKLDEQE